MATTRTRRELIDAVLDNLGVLVPGQAPSDEEVGRVDSHIDSTIAELEAQEIVYVANAGTASPPNGGEIELAIFNALADCLAWAVAPAFNLAGDPALKVISDQAEETLRRIQRPPRTRKLLTTDIQLRAGHRYAPFNFTTGQ